MPTNKAASSMDNFSGLFPNSCDAAALIPYVVPPKETVFRYSVRMSSLEKYFSRRFAVMISRTLLIGMEKNQYRLRGNKFLANCWDIVLPPPDP